MKRLIAVILLVALLIYSIYMVYSQPRTPVVVVRPQQAQPETQSPTPPPAQVQPVPICNAIYLKIGNTQLCGTITSLFYTTTGYQIAMKSGWISGQFIIVTPPTCSVSTTGNIVNIPCYVEAIVPTGSIQPSNTQS